MSGRTRLLAYSTVLAAAVTVVASAAQPSAAQPSPVQHWGSFTGGTRSAQDTLLSPAGVNIPDRAGVVQVGSSNSTDYALMSDGTVWAWGEGLHGQLGNGTDNNALSTAVQVQFPAGVSIAFLATNSMPFDGALAVDTQGNAWGWGYNEFGEFCLGNTNHHNRPVKLPFTNVTTLAGASGHAVYDAGGVVYSCGSNGAGVLGAGAHHGNALTPARVKGLNGSQVTTLVSAYENAGALLGDGRYYDWGLNTRGQLGDGSTTSSSVPVQVSLPGFASVVQAAEGGSQSYNGQTMVQLSDGSLYAWGDNSYHQIDQIGPAKQLTPLQIHAPQGVTYAVLASNGGTSYAVSTNGQVYAWGENDFGQVGDGTTQEATSPVHVTSGASVISATGRNVVVGAAQGRATNS